MPLLKIAQDTFFKKFTAQSSKLKDKDKVAVSSGQTFNAKYAYRVGSHCFVKLEEELGTLGKIGYFFLEHVSVPIEEVRAVWLTNVDSDILDSRRNIKAGLQKLKDLGFNTIYPVVWQRGFTLYPSDVAEAFTGSRVMPSSLFTGRDMLAEIIEEVKPHGFRVIPWFEYGLMTLPGSAIEKRHNDLFTLANDKSKIRIKTADAKRDDHIWLNPCQPEVQKFIVDLIADVAQRYEIDGVQLDDHFGFPVELGYDQFTEDLFKTETGRPAPIKHTDSDWVNFASKKVTDLLKQIFEAVKAKRLDCLVSISPNPLNFSRNYYLADWKSWVDKGLVEELVLQVYRPDLSKFITEINKKEVIETNERILCIAGILTGLSNQPVSAGLIREQISASRSRKTLFGLRTIPFLAGVSFFFYETFFNNISSNHAGGSPLISKVARARSDIDSFFA